MSCQARGPIQKTSAEVAGLWLQFQTQEARLKVCIKPITEGVATCSYHLDQAQTTFAGKGLWFLPSDYTVSAHAVHELLGQ